MNRLFLFLGMTGFVIACHAQNISGNSRDEFEAFRRQAHADLQDFRMQNNEQFIDFVRQAWKNFKSKDPLKIPHEEEVPPVVIKDGEEEKRKKDNPIVIDEVIAPKPLTPQPTPISPIKEDPTSESAYIKFDYYGTPCRVRRPVNHLITLSKLTSNAVADALSVLTNKEYDNLIYDCIRLRDSMQLCDWAYLYLLQQVSDIIYRKGSNESVLLMAYMYMQSGYMMRLAEANNQLYMLFASRHTVYELPFYEIGGTKFYAMSDKVPERLSISEAKYPNEQSLSFMISNPMKLSERNSDHRSIKSKRFPDVTSSVQVNKNLIDFYNSYPTSHISDDFMTRWAMYAMVPLQESIRNTLYPQLRKAISGRNQLSAVNRLLNWVQTGFVYEYDDKVWGHDRAFFPEETLYYPYCDCEDRSILFSRLVRDLLGLDVLLVYYPGHLAAAVGFTENVSGDYIMHNGMKYVIADPTYINAPVGLTMPKMENSKAKVILLK